MQVPLEISFRGIEETDEIKDLVREKVSKLERVCRYMISCRVAVERRQQHQQSGNPFRVRIEIRVPHAQELVVRREHDEGDMHDPLPTVLRRAFDAARRQLQKLVQRQRREVKRHEEQRPLGTVASLYEEEGYGFLESGDGREIYFHRNSVLNDEFRRLRVGMAVRFVEKDGEKGPQASTVQIVKKATTRTAETEESEVEAMADVGDI
jgi:ribosomal subunit interface protein